MKCGLTPARDALTETKAGFCLAWAPMEPCASSAELTIASTALQRSPGSSYLFQIQACLICWYPPGFSSQASVTCSPQDVHSVPRGIRRQQQPRAPGESGGLRTEGTSPFLLYDASPIAPTHILSSGATRKICTLFPDARKQLTHVACPVRCFYNCPLNHLRNSWGDVSLSLSRIKEQSHREGRRLA